MSSPNEFLEKALGDLERRRERLAEMQKGMSEVSATATAARQAVTVTVGSHGEVTDLKFPNSSYKRMTPVELASTIMKTISDARDKALKQSAELLGPMLPPGLSAEEMLRGKMPNLAAIRPSYGLDTAEQFFEQEGDRSS